jgi:hypothetical protein
VGKVKVERLTISAGSSLAIYDRNESSQDLFFEDTAELGVYKVTLVEGTYSHNGQEGEEGSFEANMSIGGSWHGHVLTSMADPTPDGVPASVTLTLKVEQ